MPVQASAGIAFSDRALRYAEIQQSERGFRLLRLGQCDFDFDLNRTLTDPGSAGERKVISDALAEALGVSPARRIRAALHPPLCRSFFSAHDGGDPVESVTHEAELLGFAHDGQGGGIGADAAGRTPNGELLHVTAIRPVVLQNLGGIVSDLQAEDAQAVSALRASAEVVRLSGLDVSGNGCLVAIGHFDNLMELAVLDASGWRFATHVRGLQDPGDVIHHVSEALRTLGWSPADVTLALAFGSRDLPNTLKTLFGDRVRKINPLSLLDLDRDSLDPEYAATEFVPAVGAALL